MVATHENEFSKSAAAPNQNAISVEKVDEYTAAIYQYVPGQIAAKYTFSIPKPLPALEARNAYAYDIKVEPAAENYTVSYRLNAPAESVKVQMFVDGEMTKEYEGTTVATYGDYEMTTLKTSTLLKSRVPTFLKTHWCNSRLPLQAPLLPSLL